MMKYIPLSLVILFCFILGGMVFKSVTPPRCDSLLENDNIFVLTGDVRRIPYAIKKLETLKYGQLYIIGAGTTTNVLDMPHVKVESLSKSTYQNALAIKQIVQKRKLNRIVIVTTEDHMNRSLYLLRDELPTTDIIACPASLSGMPTPGRVKRWTIEYLKYIVTLFGIKEG
ncbi:MAG: YdcF family protein [Alphaproteobacteria bacterium]|nr:YdcF family protein [Alphaproteobacteria bacterium]